jgi:DNA-binding response OmpR family regulator
MRLDEALALALYAPLDFAILDINLGGKTRSDGVARARTKRSVPFLFMSGYGDAGADEEFHTVLVIAKPAATEAAQDTVSRAMNL